MANSAESESGFPENRGEGWEDLHLEHVRSKPRYDRMTNGPVLYVPVIQGDALLGFLWASFDGVAANFMNRNSSGAAGRNSKGAWVRRLLDSKAEGLTSVEAMERWIGEDEDERAGRIPSNATPKEAQNLSALENIVNE